MNKEKFIKEQTISKRKESR